MKLEMRGQLRLEQRMKLAPHMIQSMEILQLPILALQERIEQELNSNPVLEAEESPSPEEEASTAEGTDEDSDEKEAGTEILGEKPEDFGRFDNLDDGYREHLDQNPPFRYSVGSGELDRKFEAIKNTAAPPQSLHEYLCEQWRMVEAGDAVKKAGSMIIDYIDERGYLSVRLEQLHNKDSTEFSFEDLQEALELVQKLEPAGVGARDLKECLLIQMAQSSNEMSFEARLVSEHMDELLDNHLPDIAKKMHCSIEEIKRAIRHMSKLDTSPGLQIGQDRNHAIAADIIVEPLEEAEGYSVRLSESHPRNLRINKYYTRMLKGSDTNENTKQFLQNNIRSAQWIIEAIEQRKRTLLKVAKAVVKHQKEFFDKGQLYLRPLPMSKIADEIGVHLATVSRAVAGKYILCEWGVLPLRKFFSGGKKDINGRSHSWEAIRAKLQQIIDAEDKSKPLNDEKIQKKLAEAGINGVARRTVAKYRKLLNIPSARLRKRY
ncbi:MAG: RNA polymerase factor sigma-54 [Planctomycetota bacterium]|jgi:RNA polymerase sigma-54 factor